MVLGYHVVFGTYGFWLPNDPRGSWSDFVGAWELRRFGPAARPLEAPAHAGCDHERAARLAARQALKYPAVAFNDRQIESVATGFGKYARDAKLIVWACAILPEHVHLVIARFRLDVEQVAIQLKGRAAQQLGDDRLHPFQDLRAADRSRPNCWARGAWKVFLNSAEDIERAITYVEENPVKEGRPRQHWDFVQPVEM